MKYPELDIPQDASKYDIQPKISQISPTFVELV